MGLRIFKIPTNFESFLNFYLQTFWHDIPLSKELMFPWQMQSDRYVFLIVFMKILNLLLYFHFFKIN